jgi:hypothetical protein
MMQIGAAWLQVKQYAKENRGKNYVPPEERELTEKDALVQKSTAQVFGSSELPCCWGKRVVDRVVSPCYTMRGIK